MKRLAIDNVMKVGMRIADGHTITSSLIDDDNSTILAPVDIGEIPDANLIHTPGLPAHFYDYQCRSYVGYSPGIDRVKIHSNIVLAKIHAKLKARDHALWAYLVHRSERWLLNRDQHVIHKHDAETFIGGDRADLLQSLTRLTGATMTVSAVDDNGKRVDFGTNFLNFGLESGADGMLAYWFPKPLLYFLAEPGVYSLFHLETFRRFETPAGARLFMMMQMEVGKKLVNANEVTLTREDMHWIFGCFNGVRARREGELFEEILEVQPWSDFDRHVLRKAIAEINRYADFLIWCRENKTGKGSRIFSCTFFVRIKTSEEKMATARGNIPSQDEIKDSIFRRRVGYTPAGALPKRKRYDQPQTKHLKDINFGLSYVVTADTRYKSEKMAKAAGMSITNLDYIFDAWQVSCAMNRKHNLTHFDADKHWISHLSRRCNVTRSNNDAEYRDFISMHPQSEARREAIFDTKIRAYARRELISDGIRLYMRHLEKEKQQRPREQYVVDGGRLGGMALAVLRWPLESWDEQPPVDPYQDHQARTDAGSNPYDYAMSDDQVAAFRAESERLEPLYRRMMGFRAEAERLEPIYRRLMGEPSPLNQSDEDAQADAEAATAWMYAEETT